MKILAIVVLWVACGLYNFAVTLDNGYMENWSIATLVAVLGPIGTPVVLLAVDHPTHLLWKPLTKEQRWMIFHSEFPLLERCYFEEWYGSGVSCEPPVDDLELLHKLQEDIKK